MFGKSKKKETQKEEVVGGDKKTVQHVHVMPDIFYGGKDPEYYHQKDGGSLGATSLITEEQPTKEPKKIPEVPKVEEEEKKLHLWESTGHQGHFWIEVVNKIINTVPENVYLLSIESLWGIPEADKKERTSSKDFFGDKEAIASKSIDTSKEVLIIRIKGESYAPEVSYIEEKVKTPIANLTMSDQNIPAFSDVRLVQGSVHHIALPNKKDKVGDIKSTPISFELQCIVDNLN